MFRAVVSVWMGLAVALVLSVTLPANAADKVDKLAKQLRSGDDFRVRTQAALALGASKSKKAVKSLCEGLEDSNATVRAASAAALGKLKKGGKSCLEKRLEDETSSAAKKSIKKAIALLDAAAEPTITASTRYYVAIGKIIDKSGRKDKTVEKMVRESMAKAAENLDGYVLAPDGETEKDAKKRLSKFKKLKAFMLSPKIAAPKYDDGTLSVKLEVAILTYPGKALKGSIPVKLTQQDVSEKDESSEDELIKMASERAIEKFSQNVERIQ
jgi:hypothetical protein